MLTQEQKTTQQTWRNTAWNAEKFIAFRKEGSEQGKGTEAKHPTDYNKTWGIQKNLYNVMFTWNCR